MDKNNKGLVLGVVIGVTAGFVAGMVLANGKFKKIDNLKARLSNITNDAQERINALRALANRHEERTGANKN